MARVRSGYPQAEKECREQRHERPDVHIKVFLILLALIVVSGFLIHGTLWAWLISWPGWSAPAENAPWRVIGQDQPTPARQFAELQPNPQIDLQTYKRRMQQRLSSYAWINPDSAVIQIPIQRAMALVAQQGLPNWPNQGGPAQLPGTPMGAAGDIDGAFLKKMAQGSLGTIQLAQLGVGQAQNSKLADTSHKLVQEHQKLLKDIQHTAADTQTTLPHDPGLTDQLAAEKLRQEHGTTFDQTLAKQLLADTAKALEQLRQSTNQLQTHEVQKLASHLENKLETEMEDIRDAAKSTGVSEGTILVIIQNQRSAAAVAQAAEAGKSTGELQPASSAVQPSSPSQQQQQGAADDQESSGAGQGSPGSSNSGQNSQTGPKGQPNAPDLSEAFLQSTAQALLADQALGQLGVRRVQNTILSQLSRKLLDDGKNFGPKLVDLAKAAHTTLPLEPSLQDELAMIQIEQEHGRQFQQDLALQIVADQAKTIEQTEQVASRLRNSQVQTLAKHLNRTLHQRLDQAKQAARAAGLSPKQVEQTIVVQLVAAGAPYPLMVDFQNPQPATSAHHDQSSQGKASSPGGEQSDSSSASEQTQPHESNSSTNSASGSASSPSGQTHQQSQGEQQ
jgi:type VI protein secretion system component VasF